MYGARKDPYIEEADVSVPPPPKRPGLSSSQAQLFKREQEIERRERELEIKELKLTEREKKLEEFDLRVPNWPACQPLIYHNIREEIPEPARLLVTRMYHAWWLSSLTYVINVLACIALLVAQADTAGSNFGLSLLICFVGIPVAFVFWYMNLYTGCKRDTSRHFFFFFFCYGFHIGKCILQAIGIPGWGAAGFIYMSAAYSSNKDGAMAAAGLSTATFVLLICEIIWGVWQMKDASDYYRGRGMSTDKARNEIALQVTSSEFVRTAAVNQVTAGVSGGPSVPPRPA